MYVSINNTDFNKEVIPHYCINSEPRLITADKVPKKKQKSACVSQKIPLFAWAIQQPIPAHILSPRVSYCARSVA